MSQSSANTERVSRANAGMCHLEGGWDATIDASDIEQTSRYRRRLTYSAAFRRQVQQCASLATTCVRQNNVVDIFEEYWDVASSDRVGDGGDGDTADAASVSRFDEYFGDPPSLHVQAVLRYVARDFVRCACAVAVFTPLLCVASAQTATPARCDGLRSAPAGTRRAMNGWLWRTLTGASGRGSASLPAVPVYLRPDSWEPHRTRQ